MNALHTQPIQTALLRLDDDRKILLAAWEAMIGGGGAPFFPLDLLASGAVKRCVRASAAIKLLVESWNMMSARSLLRTHLDTALRFSAAWLVENPQEFATLAISGRPINKLKDREGKALTERALGGDQVSRLALAAQGLREPMRLCAFICDAPVRRRRVH